MDLKDNIHLLRNESIQFNSNDLLVHIDDKNPKLFFSNSKYTFPISIFPKSILTETKKHLKESGTNTLCLNQVTIRWKLKKEEVCTPLIIEPIRFQVDKINETISFQSIEDDAFINPFVIYHLKSAYSIEFNDSDTDIVSFLKDKNFIITEGQQVIGNFHHHRYKIIKELEELLLITEYPSSLKNMFGFGDSTSNYQLQLCPDNLYDADIDHELVFQKVSKSDVVIQGPPGTGKSQVLSNILGKALFKKNTTVVVSEKRAALEVLKQKLGQYNLDKLCFITTSNSLTHSFFQDLKSTWSYFEEYNSEKRPNLRLSEQYVDQLQFTLSTISQEGLIGGVSFAEYTELSKEMSIDISKYNSSVDSIDLFLKIKPIIKSIYKKELNEVVGSLNCLVFTQSNFSQFDQKIISWIKLIEQLKVTFSLTNKIDLDELIKRAVDCQIFENSYYKKYKPLFKPNSQKQKQFLRLRKKFNRIKVEIEGIQKDNTHWKIVPSEVETNSLLRLLSKNTFFTRRRVRKRWFQLSHLSFNEAAIALNTHLEKIKVINSYSRLTIEFCELGLDNPETEVDQVYNSIHSLSQESWKTLHELSIEARQKITSHHNDLQNIQRDIRTYFNIDKTDDILGTLLALKKNFGLLISHQNELKQLTQNTLNSFKRNTLFTDFEAEIYVSHLLDFRNIHPTLADFSISDIKQKVDQIIELRKSESVHFSKLIEGEVSTKFKYYHKILTTSARKLTEEEKRLKPILRKGKSILVKEFAKTKRHPSLREIYNSEARIWISLLKPIWLGNPSQLANCFPMEKGLFDLVIFDEASQIPLQNALGAIHRGKRVVIAGDEHQMSPNFYFKSYKQEPIDLLHQANFNLSKVALTHHYRSKHPDLISFSNKHIYSESLSAYPSYKSETPIQYNYCNNSVYKNRRNINEAKSVAKEIEKRLATKKSIGIVAFSEEQLNCIWDQLSTISQEKLSNRMDDNTLFFKSLENVQGDECDHLIISFGFGKNEDGEFHHRFGPMSTVSGRKRLNVLVTRAKETISFYCSIKSNEFKISENESINLLRQWVQFTETYKKSDDLKFPFELKPTVKDKTLIFNSIQQDVTSAKELVTLQSVLKGRGWDIEYN